MMDAQSLDQFLNNTQMSWEEKARKAVAAMKELLKPPLVLATYLDHNPQTKTAQVVIGGKPYVVNYLPQIESELYPGASVVLDPQTFGIVNTTTITQDHALALVYDILDDGSVVIRGPDGKKVLPVSSKIKKKIHIGDQVLVDSGYHKVLQHLGNESRYYKLAKVPEVPWEKVGGLEDTIQQLREQIEKPFLYPDLYKKYQKRPIKGALIYGPPGCGKTLLAKALAYNLARIRQQQQGGALNGYFLTASGPEFLQRYVGDGEEKVRSLFHQARKTSEETGGLVVIYLDEVETVMKKRGTGISSDASESIVQEFLYQMDGIRENENILVLLATNRHDVLDPAIIRPGRIDRKIYVGRPNRQATKAIFEIYLRQQPLKKTRMFQDPGSDYAQYATSLIFEQYLPQAKIILENAQTKILEFKHLLSGATIENIVNRATDYAFQRAQQGKEYRIIQEDLAQAITAEYQENREFLNLITLYDLKKIGRNHHVINIEPFYQ